MTFSRTMTARGIKRDSSRAGGRRFVGFQLLGSMNIPFNAVHDDDAHPLV